MAQGKYCYFYLLGQSVELFLLPAPCDTSIVFKFYDGVKKLYEDATIIGIYGRNSSNEKGDNVTS